MDGIPSHEIALEQLNKGIIVPVQAASEANWYQVWNEQGLHDCGPIEMALSGGALADRLAWVFLSGYQGMIRYAFPSMPRNGWASYLVAEDKSGEYPGAQIDRSGGQIVLSGNKSWVAASRHTSQLFVRVSMGDDLIVRVSRNSDGVTINHRQSPGFLGELSQGFVSFNDVIVPEEQILSVGDLPPNFAHLEPQYVLTALNAFMLSHINRLGGFKELASDISKTLHGSCALDSGEAVGDEFFLAVADMDAASTRSAQGFEDFINNKDKELHARWMKDKGLVNMFSRGLQKRASWLRGG